MCVIKMHALGTTLGISYGVFSCDARRAMLVSLNKGTGAMLVSLNNPIGIELYSQMFSFVLVEKHAHCSHK